jgi:hypothetical protein
VRRVLMRLRICAVTLCPLYVLFAIEVGTRHVHVLECDRTRTGRGPCITPGTC